MTAAATKAITREELLDICARALATPQAAWHNRDSSAATRQLGEAYALLRAGCDFYVSGKSDADTLWVYIEFRGFDYFEGDFDGMGPLEAERFYLPTAERLDRVDGKDWY